MRIQIKSDLHLEYSDHDVTNPTDDDVLILAGDIFPIAYLMNNLKYKKVYEDFLEKCHTRFKNVIYVLGNHCHYYGDIKTSVSLLKQYCAKYPNIHILEKESITIDGITFIGTTLWTNMNSNDVYTMMYSNTSLADYTLITKDGGKLSPSHTVELFYESMEYLSTEIKKHDKVVVVTHHAPSLKSLHSKFKGDALNGAFLNDLDDFIAEQNNLVCWVHGHCHSSFDYTIGSTMVICNPRGYNTLTYSEDTGYDPKLRITI